MSPGEILLCLAWPAIVVVLTVWLTGRRALAYQESAKAATALLTDSRDSNAMLLKQFNAVVACLTTHEQQAIDYLRDSSRLLLGHDAAMAGSQLTVLVDALRNRIDSSDKFVLTLIHTFIAAQGRTGSAAAPLDPAEVERFARALDGLPPELETVPPMQQQ